MMRCFFHCYQVSALIEAVAAHGLAWRWESQPGSGVSPLHMAALLSAVGSAPPSLTPAGAAGPSALTGAAGAAAGAAAGGASYSAGVRSPGHVGVAEWLLLTQPAARAAWHVEGGELKLSPAEVARISGCAHLNALASAAPPARHSLPAPVQQPAAWALEAAQQQQVQVQEETQVQDTAAAATTGLRRRNIRSDAPNTSAPAQPAAPASSASSSAADTTRSRAAGALRQKLRLALKGFESKEQEQTYLAFVSRRTLGG